MANKSATALTASDPIPSEPSLPESSAASPKPVASPKPDETLTIAEYLAREPRLARRPEMRHAFALACRRANLHRATPDAFARRLDQLERG